MRYARRSVFKWLRAYRRYGWLLAYQFGEWGYRQTDWFRHGGIYPRQFDTRKNHSLDQGKTAVGGESLADDPGGFGGAEERDDARKIFRFSDAAGRSSLQHFLPELIKEGE